MRSVVIIGAGPAGLTAARALAAAGLRDVLVLEREQDAGGVPRHCGHPGFGMVDFKRFLTGPAYARRLADAAAGAEIRTGVSVLRLAAGGSLEVSGPNGIEALQARAVLIATGTRETPRSARLVSGSRPSGVLTTGALQQMVYLAGLKPFERPVIVGS
jgi:cation diffusion facilitator CzcD-associated flavoprotein CzcO